MSVARTECTCFVLVSHFVSVCKYLCALRHVLKKKKRKKKNILIIITCDGKQKTLFKSTINNNKKEEEKINPASPLHRQILKPIIMTTPNIFPSPHHLKLLALYDNEVITTGYATVTDLTDSPSICYTRVYLGCFKNHPFRPSL